MNAIEILIKLTRLNQKDFAQAIGVPAPNLSEMKTGKRDISLSRFIEWCEHFGISPAKVFDKLEKIKRESI